MRSTVSRRRFLRAAGSSLLLPLSANRAFAQASRTLSIEPRSATEQAAADAEVNAAERHALVIGNGRYASVPGLKNPPNDAKAIGGQLSADGFQVDVRQDLTRDAMIDAIKVYAARLTATRSVGLFFFAGHGVQLAWRNFLVPVDARIDKVEDIPERCLDLGVLIEGLKRAGNPMNIVVLDACRNNPFSGVKLDAKGLSQFDAPPRSLLAYATSPGNVASDGEGENGLYTENLLRELKVPETKIEDVFKRVRLGVRRRSNGRQIPWESTSLEEDFYFVPPKQIRPVTDSEANRRFDEELKAWDQVQGIKDPAPLEEFIRLYPSSQFTELAQVMLDKLLAAQGEKKIEIVSDAQNPYSSGTGVVDTAYKLGDFYSYRLNDLLTGVEQRRFTETVVEIIDNEIRFDNGRVIDLLGNTIRTRDGRVFQGQKNLASTYQVGKRWTARARFRTAQGITGNSVMDFRVVAREKIIVPLGTFDAFKVEGAGYYDSDQLQGNGTLLNVFWIAPEKLRQPVRVDELRRFNGRFRATNSIELTDFKENG